MNEDIVVHIQDLTVCGEIGYNIQGIWGETNAFQIRNMESDLLNTKLKIPECKEYMISVRCKMTYSDKKRRWNYKILGYVMYNLFTKETSIIDKSIFNKFILNR